MGFNSGFKVLMWHKNYNFYFVFQWGSLCQWYFKDA